MSTSLQMPAHLVPSLQSLLTVPPPYAVWCCKSAKLPCGIYTMPKSRHLLLYYPYNQHLLLAVVENFLTSVSPLFHPDSCCDSSPRLTHVKSQFNVPTCKLN
ncbi:hypothetical protein ATANTOWER_023393 [Ataeniobius toweri]|uniref:Uncharacterized protein n=1 Tax=Ataeniobius toweri TaxID=208326 RepID=A0ABU7CI99_9TELE|nr:hypothetical protein [Ataeniobius toweri]